MTSTAPDKSLGDRSGHTEWTAGSGLFRLIPWFPITAERLPADFRGKDPPLLGRRLGSSGNPAIASAFP
ncbi:MAG: hypothetical protein PHP75_03785 [Methylacidiphilaceae bacterium]|nr:hypothetical protein [Candidatus Methylacidiphilaceae bacterium]